MQANAINSINNTTKPQEHSRILVDNKLLQSLEEESSDIKSLDIDKRNIRKSKAGMRKMKYNVRNQSNILSIKNKNNISPSNENKLNKHLMKLQEKKYNKTIEKTNIKKLNSQTKSAIVEAIRIEWKYFNGIYSHIAYYPNNMMVVTNSTGQYCYRNNILYASSKTWKNETINGILYAVFYYPDGKIYSNDTSQYIYKN